MTGFTPETEACLACHPSQKDAGPMTDTAAREEAVERVRAYVEACSKRPDNWLADELGPRDDYLTLTLGDLRLLLSGGEGGRHLAQRAAARETHPDTPSQPSASDVGKIGAAILSAIIDEHGDLTIELDGGPTLLSEIVDYAALTGPRQPSEAPVTAMLSGLNAALGADASGCLIGMGEAPVAADEEWEECSSCNGIGLVRVGDVYDNPECPTCQGHGVRKALPPAPPTGEGVPDNGKWKDAAPPKPVVSSFGPTRGPTGEGGGL